MNRSHSSWWLPCREATRLASEALDRPLTRRERLALRIHLAICWFCRRYTRQIALLHELLHQHGQEAVGPGLSAPARMRLQAAVREAS